MFRDKRILIVAPHFDDEIIGCGSIIANKENNVTIFVPTGYNDLSALRVLEDGGINILHPNNLYRDQELENELQSTLIDELRYLIKSHDIDTVFMPYIHDANNDHKFVATCTNIATRPYDSNVTSVFMYEIPETTMLSTEKFTPNLYLGFNWENKEKLLKAYYHVPQCGPHPRSIDSLRINAEYRGNQSGKHKYAEAFQILRFIV